MDARTLLEKQIIKDASEGDTTILFELLNSLPDNLILNSLLDENKLLVKFYYEIHVTGKESFSTSVVSDKQLDDDDIIMLAYEQDKLEGDDCHYVDYIEELTFEEWNTHFNFK